MQLSFVAQAADPMGKVAIEILQRKGQHARLLGEHECAGTQEIAFFTSQNYEAFGRSRRILRVAPHKFEGKAIDVPAWARATPFLVAIRPDTLTQRPYERLADAVQQVAETYGRWNPWADPVAPWCPYWHQGAAPEAFDLWRKQAQERVPPPPFEVRAAQYLTPVFEPSRVGATPTLVVIGCAAFNRPHTDVVDSLLPEKVSAVVKNLAALVAAGDFARVQVAVPDGSLLDEAIVREHLHPFIFMSVGEAEEALKKPFGEPTRLWDRQHRRSLSEISEAFDASAAAMKRQVIEPLSQATSREVEAVSWMGMVRPYLQRAQGLVAENLALLEEIYRKRVETRPSYQTLHAVDPAAGLRRTVGNAVLYVAEALYLCENPEHVVANFEANDVYWKGLEPLLRPLWGDRVPYIGMARVPYRQPWGY